MFAHNRHNDGLAAIWIPASPGLQAELIHTSPEKYFMPPYASVRGWIGVEFGFSNDEDLAFHIQEGQLYS